MTRPEGPWHLVIAETAQRALRKIDPPVRRRIITAITALGGDPYGGGSVKRLVGERDTWRLRVGDYRIVYVLVDDRLIVTVVRIAHRREVYER